MDLMSKAAGYAIAAAVQTATQHPAGPRLPFPSNYDEPATRQAPGYAGSSGDGAFLGVNTPFGTPTKPTTAPRPTKPGQVPVGGVAGTPPTKPGGTLAGIADTVRGYVAQGQTQFTVTGPQGNAHAIDTEAQTSNGRPWSQRVLDWFNSLGAPRSNVVQSSNKSSGVTASAGTPVASTPLTGVNYNNPVIVRPNNPNSKPPIVPPYVRPPTPPAGGGSSPTTGGGGSSPTTGSGGSSPTTGGGTTGGGSSPGSGNTGTDTTGTTGNTGLDQTLADIFSQVFGSSVGFTPQTSDSGGDVLVVPGEATAAPSNSNAMLGLVVVAGVGVAFWYFTRRKKGGES